MFSKRIATTISLLFVAVALTGLGASSAVAETHPFLFSFGSFSNPNGIAVDQASGDVYVADIETDTVQKFDGTGNPVEFAALHSNTLSGAATPAGSFSFPSAYGNPAAIAVDNSTSPSDPSAGDLYVMDAGNHVIDKFSSSGVYLGQIAGPFSGELLGIGVDGSGDVRVYGSMIDLFDDSVANNFVTQYRITRTEPGERAGFAVSPTGDMYLLGGCDCMERLGSSVESFGRVDNNSDVAAAVDGATGHLYVDDESSVTEWDTGEMNGLIQAPQSNSQVSTGTQVASFGSFQLAPSSGEGGIAVNGVNGDIYVANPPDGKVYVFGTDVPAVGVGTAENITKTSATLEGTVDPRGATIVSCQFEYGTSESSAAEALAVPIANLSHVVPCAQTPTQIGSGTTPVPVTADVSGLQPGLLYRVRLVAPQCERREPEQWLVRNLGPRFRRQIV